MKKTYDLRRKMPGPAQRNANATQSQRPKSPVTSVTVPRMQSEDPSSVQPTLADVQKSLSDFSGKVCTKLDEIHTDITCMKKKMADLEATVADNAARVLDIEKGKLPEMGSKLQKEIDLLNEKLLLSEIYHRKANLLFYGIEKKPNENVERVLREAFKAIGLSEEEAESIALINAHRLPNGNVTNNAPQPIIAKFIYMAQRNRLLSAFEGRTVNRRGNDQEVARPNPRITVRTDLPPALKAQRSILATKAYNLRKENNLSTKIVVTGTKVTLFTKEKNSTAEWKAYKE
ncbi:uncharacterized protein LOC121421124 [Lytechinus variegatus]|uniref:uncharacterized protein LOC121421124 n=1 Tax=Lytechinus variegatus TaxID=7654 RepID=UPI001BB2BDF5|nr:uncharacterized protein LOC121421124 [Lytechinus variegatus]